MDREERRLKWHPWPALWFSIISPSLNLPWHSSWLQLSDLLLVYYLVSSIGLEDLEGMVCVCLTYFSISNTSQMRSTYLFWMNFWVAWINALKDDHPICTFNHSVIHNPPQSTSTLRPNLDQSLKNQESQARVLALLIDCVIFFLKTCFFLMWTIFKVLIEFVTILLLLYVLVFWLQGKWDLSSLTGGWTHTACIGRRSLNHWTAREVPDHVILNNAFDQI